MEAFAEADGDRDEQGRMRLTPMVRIPQEGDEDFKWAIKQVLDLGGLGVIVPHVDTGDEAVRLVQAARYPPARDDAQPEPRGERGWGPGRATRLWGVDRPSTTPRRRLAARRRAVVAMVESAEAVANIDDILAAPVSAIMVVPGDMSIDLGLGPAPGPENRVPGQRFPGYSRARARPRGRVGRFAAAKPLWSESRRRIGHTQDREEAFR